MLKLFHLAADLFRSAEDPVDTFSKSLGGLISRFKGRVSDEEMVREIEIHLAGLTVNRPWTPEDGDPPLIIHEGQRVELVHGPRGTFRLKPKGEDDV